MDHLDLWLVWAAAIPATCTPLLYGLAAPWWRRLEGWAVMVSGAGLALLLDLALLLYYWTPPNLAAARNVALVVYALITLGAWLVLLALVRAQVLRRRR